MAAPSACSDEENDPVVKEIDVYLSKKLSDSLYLLQYPLKSSHKKIAHDEVLGGRVKPVQQKVELEVSLDTQSDNYSRSRGEQIAVNVDGVVQGSDGAMFTCGMMDRQLYTSTTVLDSVAPYAAGIFINDELHITPLHSILQMKPSFSYLDKADKKSKAGDGTGAGNDTGESSQDEEQDVKPVTVKFARRDTERSRDIRMKSYAYLQEKRNEEQWVPLLHHTVRDTMSGIERESLICRLEDDTAPETITLDKTEQQYLDVLVPETEELQQDKPTLPNNIISLTQLRTQPLSDQIRTLMINAKLIQFNTLHSLVGNKTDTSTVLKSLQQYAVLVRGCWVVKSEVLYPKDTFSPNTGIPSELLCRGRDYVMWKFNKSRYMTRSEVSGVVKLPSDDLKDVMQQMSRMKLNMGWEFILDTDTVFTDRYPDVVDRQNMVWKAKFEQLCKVLKIPKSQSPDRKTKQSKESTEIVTGAERVKAAAVKAKTRTNRLITEIGAGDTTIAIVKQEPMDTSEQLNTETIKHSLLSSEDDTDIHCSNNHQQADKPELFYTQLAEFLTTSFSTHTVLNITEMRRLLLLHLAHSPPGSTLVDHITDPYFEKTAIDIGAERLTIPWAIKNPPVADGKVYIVRNKGDGLDVHRACLTDCFKDSIKVSKGKVMKKLEEGCGPVKKDIIMQLLSEVCTQKGPYLSIKHTVPQT